MLNKQEGQRYFKQILLKEFGLNAQIELKKARVAVVGAGGLGCPVLLYLNAVGVGTIGIIDFDVVDVTNLHRQVLYTPDDVGKKKAEIARQKLSAQNPFTQFVVHDVLLNEENAESVLLDYDVIVDGCDNFATRYVVNDVCVKLGKPLVYGSILGNEGQMAVFNYQGGKQLRDIFPEAPDAEDVPSCSENGVLGTVPGIIGLQLAQMTIQVIQKTYSNHNTLILFDAKHLTIQKLHF